MPFMGGNKASPNDAFSQAYVLDVSIRNGDYYIGSIYVSYVINITFSMLKLLHHSCQLRK